MYYDEGITPACAGRTSKRGRGKVKSRDHPRVCGKDRKFHAIVANYPGSPPRVREGRPDRRRQRWCLGITPACAGRTDFPKNGLTYTRDHPRVCGKDVCTFTCILFTPGSPPRVREGLLTKGSPPAPVRITPACAGRTHALKSRKTGLKDHPRVCGKDRRRSLTKAAR